ncbi:MAG TPA: helix-turn-helix domain-containing protein [Acidimicrobiales bacterium]|nr:helix-turn-helix domain-containing protein [Acidimicrobiales bacterium]
MPEPVKKPRKRAYSSAIREEQAATTRRRIVDAAGDLFVERGYGATSIKAVAEAAGVAPDTVYAVFGSKVRLLTALIDARLVPDADAANVMERPEAEAVRNQRDQRTMVRLFARDMAATLSRVGPVFEILRTAGAVEPAVAEVYREMNGYRLGNMERFVGWLASAGPLRVSRKEAARTVWAVASPDVGRLLRIGGAWSEDQHARWLEDVLARTLLRDPV